MDKKTKKVADATEQQVHKKVSKTWEAATRLKGSLIVNDPSFLL